MGVRRQGRRRGARRRWVFPIAHRAVVLIVRVERGRIPPAGGVVVGNAQRLRLIVANPLVPTGEAVWYILLEGVQRALPPIPVAVVLDGRIANAVGPDVVARLLALGLADVSRMCPAMMYMLSRTILIAGGFMWMEWHSSLFVKLCLAWFHITNSVNE